MFNNDKWSNSAQIGHIRLQNLDDNQDGAIGFPIHVHGFLLILTLLLYEIQDFEISGTLNLTFQGHPRSNVTPPLTPIYGFILIFKSNLFA